MAPKSSSNKPPVLLISGLAVQIRPWAPQRTKKGTDHFSKSRQSPSYFPFLRVDLFTPSLVFRTRRMNGDELDFEDKRLIRPYHATGDPPGAISKIGGYVEHPLRSFFHEQQGLGPALNNLVNTKH